MLLTYDTYSNYADTSKEELKLIKQHFPEKIDTQIFFKLDLPDALLLWGLRSLPLTEEEKNDGQSKLKIERCSLIYNSYKCSDSTIVVQSSDVNKSQKIFYSQNVKESDTVNNCRIVTKSSDVYNSAFVTNSKYIYESKNITDCSNIVNSTFIVGSNNNINCQNCLSCNENRKCADCKNLFFSSNCSKITNGLFCSDISNKSNVIFNCEIDENLFNIILSQYKDFNLSLSFYSQFSMNQVSGQINPKIDKRVYNYYKDLSNDFYDWIQTLPHYDSMIMYNITFCKKFLKI